MAAQRKKASTRVRAKQGGARKGKVAPAGVRTHAARAEVSPPPRAPSKAKKKSTPSKVGRKKATPKKTVRVVAPKKSVRKTQLKKSTRKGVAKRRVSKARRPKKRQRTRTPGVVKQAQRVFKKLRSAALKTKKLVLPKFTKKKGKLRLRGTKGKERSIVVAQFWEDIRESWIESSVVKAFHSLASEFDKVPTLYSRFTFTVTKVHTLLAAGSPKLIRATRKKVKHWFFSTGLSYNVEGAKFQFEKGWDILSKTINEATRDNIDATFFLEYVTCIAYVVRA